MKANEMSRDEQTNPTIDDAIMVAAAAHKGQKDKAGVPYILHPLRVMLHFTDEQEQMAAVLHDVVEDTHVTLDMLHGHGFPARVVEAVDALSRRKKDGETYTGFVVRVSENAIARRVKMADILDNMSRMTPELAVTGLEKRYLHAMLVLQGTPSPEAAYGMTGTGAPVALETSKPAAQTLPKLPPDEAYEVPTLPGGLVALNDFNQKRKEQYTDANQSPHAARKNGIACPKCGRELFDSQPLVTVGAGAPQKHIHCASCSFRGYRVA